MKKITLLLLLFVTIVSYGQTTSGFITNPSFETGATGSLTKDVALNDWVLSGADATDTGVLAAIQTSNIHSGNGSNSLEVSNTVNASTGEARIKVTNSTFPFTGDNTTPITVTVEFWAKTTDVNPVSHNASGDLKLVLSDATSSTNKSSRAILTTGEWVYVSKTFSVFPAATNYSLSLSLQFAGLQGVTQIDGMYASVTGGATLGRVTWDGSTDSEWTTPANWDTNTVPTAGDHIIIADTGTPPVINSTTGAKATYLTIDEPDGLTISNGGSVLVTETSTGNITYKKTVADTNWHLMASPVVGEGYDGTWIADNLIDDTSSAGTNVGIATYINTSDADGDWTYITDGGTGTFATGQGYSIKRDAFVSDISFTGTLKTDDASLTITANDLTGGNENRWTLIGNPFSSYISVTSLLDLTANGTALEDSREALYVYDNDKVGGAGYSPITTGYILPGQGFFVNSDVASTSITISQDMLSHQTGVAFYKSSTSKTSINLMISDGTITKSTEINFIADKTTGLDPRFDLGTFTGASTSFSIYSHLVSDSKGVNFMRQALPLDYENQIIPIGVNATAGKEIYFSAEALNLPSDIKVFLEDRVNKTFTRLDEENSSLKVTLNESLNGTGRFYLHTKTSSVLSLDSDLLNSVSVFRTNNNNLKITGLSQGKASVSLYNLLGKQVMTVSFDSANVNNIALPNLSTGVYIVKLQAEQGTLNKKIILE